MESIYDVIIVGSGAAGIAAARELGEKNIDYVILEGTGNVGGRARTRDGIDEGGAWIHFGYDKENPFPGLCKKVGVQVKKSSWSNPMFFDEKRGEQISETVLEKGNKRVIEFFKKFETKRKAILKSQSKDVSVTELMSEEYERDILGIQDEQERRVCLWFIKMIENQEASSLSDLSTKIGVKWRDIDLSDGGPDDLIPIGGYGSFIEKLAINQPIKLNHVVREIDYSKNPIELTVETSEKTILTLQTKQVLVTVSLGVLKRNFIKFTPELPQEKQNFINLMGYGLMNKIIVEFESCFWEKDQPDCFSIIAEEKGVHPLVFNLYPFTQRNILISYLTDDFAKRMQDLQDKQKVLEHFLDTLKRSVAKIYPKIPKVLNYRVTDWGNEELFWGSYSHFAPGSSESLLKAMKNPVLDKLYFAGEALCAEYLGTVHGAFLTGKDQAKKIIQLLKK